jgi:serine phosphatase RsbU (regulator of sigma subunit)
VVGLASDALQSDFERSGSFVTLLHAHLNVATQVLTYVNAGHGYGFVYRAAGAAETLMSSGLPLGILPHQTYHEHAIALGPGDALVIYSDGLVEAQPEGVLTPGTLSDRLVGAASAQEIVDRLVAQAGLSGAPADDLTVVVLRRPGPA